MKEELRAKQEIEKKAAEILKQLSLSEKVSLLNGKDFWHSRSMDQYGIPAITMSDGPHGLRCQKGEADMLGVNQSEPATCFPTAVTSGAAWNRELLRQEGEAIGEEGLSLGVDVVLGPGVNMKRDPRCGRNFEYFSEDPYLAGQLGKAWIRGAENTGIGTSLKHFAANNQEYKRFNGNSQIDERTLREIYLPAFETAVKEAKPSTVMCAYPQLNGVHMSDNRKLLTDILRKEWGYQGMVVTDWGALCDRVKAAAAGCDLSMPGGSEFMEDAVISAVQEGKLSEEAVDQCALRVLKLAFSGLFRRKNQPFDMEKHHELARRIAEEGAVLLKNEDDILPIGSRNTVLIGEMARTMRFQGSGSSHINPIRVTSLTEALPDVEFAACCDRDGSVTEASLEEARQAARNADIAIVCAGLPDLYESEGFDRENLDMPEGHNRMIEAVAEVNPNTVVVLFGGGVMETPWYDKVKAVLYMGLPGEAGGEAAASLLTGKANPSGKLGETWPLSLKDVPDLLTFGKKYTCYTEGIYMGYRYYEKASLPVRFPFGYGLSYTRFRYSDLAIDDRKVSLNVTNVGKRAGGEVVQLYVGAPQNGIHRPVKELKRFEKIFLQPGETKNVSFLLDDRCFAVWADGWKIPEGDYEIQLGSSSADIRLKGQIFVNGEKIPVPAWQADSWYEKLTGKPSEKDFEASFGGAVQREPEIKVGKLDLEMSLMEMKDVSPVMKAMYDSTVSSIAEGFDGKADFSDPSFRMLVMSGTDAPLRAAILSSGGSFSEKMALQILEMANQTN